MRKSILVVDDQKEILEMLESLLVGEGFGVLTADSAFKALEILQQQAPDAMVLDMMMQDRPGIELLENIRWDPKLSSLPVVCLSADSLSGETRKFIEEFSLGLVDKSNMQEVVDHLKREFNAG